MLKDLRAFHVIIKHFEKHCKENRYNEDDRDDVIFEYNKNARDLLYGIALELIDLTGIKDLNIGKFITQNKLYF